MRDVQMSQTVGEGKPIGMQQEKVTESQPLVHSVAVVAAT